MDTGVAKNLITDFEEYQSQLKMRIYNLYKAM